MPARILLVFALNTLVSLPLVFCQTTTPAAPPDRPVIHTSTREVLVDMVVRDKHHHAVTDLRPEEVQIYEDGVLQTVRVFRSIRGAEQLETERGAAAAAPAPHNSGETAHPLNSMRQINFVSVVFAEIAPSIRSSPGAPFRNS